MTPATRTPIAALLALFTLLVLGACQTTTPTKVTTIAPPPPEATVATEEEPVLVARGVASYYADRFHGRMTANGETFDMTELTAAHRTLPFDTWVRVTNLSNGQQVVVRINDRGPYIDGRIIDLSKGAAEEIGMIEPGITEVKIEAFEEQIDQEPSMQS